MSKDGRFQIVYFWSTLTDDFLQILLKSYYSQTDREQDGQKGITESRVAFREANARRDYGLKSTRCNWQSMEEEVIKRAMTDICGLLLGATSVRSPYDREEALCEVSINRNSGREDKSVQVCV